MFSSNLNTSGIRSEYSSIATGNVTTTIDNLHTAQTQLQATQNALAAAADPGHRPPATACSGPESQASHVGQPGPGHARQRQRQHPAPGRSSSRPPRPRPRRRRPRQRSTPRWPRHRRPRPQPRPPRAGGPADHRRLGLGRRRGRRCRRAAASARWPPVRPGPSRRPRARSASPTSGAARHPAGFDCSGLVQWAYAQVGISLPALLGGPVRRHHPHPAGRHRAR